MLRLNTGKCLKVQFHYALQIFRNEVEISREHLSRFLFAFISREARLEWNHVLLIYLLDLEDNEAVQLLVWLGRNVAELGLNSTSDWYAVFIVNLLPDNLSLWQQTAQHSLAKKGISLYESHGTSNLA